MKTIRLYQRILFLAGFLLSFSNSHAHQASDSYLNLVFSSTNAIGQWDILANELESIIGLDDNDDGSISPQEMLAHQQAIDHFVMKHITLKVDGVEMPPNIVDHELAAQPEGLFVSLKFTLPELHAPKTVEIGYNLFFDINPQHRGLFLLECEGKKQTAIFTPASSIQSFQLGMAHPQANFLQFLREGAWHIWHGYDHIMFLIALLIPAVLRRQDNRWREISDFRPALLSVLRIVTAFTIAHSITLSLATLKIVEVPSRFIETVIALSVALAAFNNIRPVFRDGAWMIAFVFGLIHGFGFANALIGLGTSNTALATTLLGFNLGVELGQLAIVAVFLPVAFSLRRSWFYQRVTVVFGSLLIVMCASLWMVDRIFQLKLMPF